MKVIIDTNILISALIKDSTTRKIIIKANWDFNYPEISFHEIRKYKQLILDKSGMDDKEFLRLIGLLMEKINLVPEEQFKKHLNEANKLMGIIDPDDVVFLATALSYHDSIIWSDDKDFEKQDKIVVFKTGDIVNLFRKDEE